MLLGLAGLLDDVRATLEVPRLDAGFVSGRIVEYDQQWSRTAVLTPAGISAGIDMALKAVALLRQPSPRHGETHEYLSGIQCLKYEEAVSAKPFLILIDIL
jgi:hypothetical protein